MKYGPPSYSVPMHQYGPPKMKFTPHDKPSSFPDLFNKKPGFKAISKISHGPRIPTSYNNKNIGLKPQYGPPKRHYFTHPVPQVKGHCDGWIPILGPTLPEAHNAPSSSTSYVAPSISYGAPSGSYGAPLVSYGTPSVSYGTPSTSYGAPSASYSGPSISYGAPSPSYGAPSISLGSSHSSIGSDIHIPAPVYGAPEPQIEILHHDEVKHDIEVPVETGLQQLADIGIINNDQSDSFDIVKSHGIEVS